jgi:hypothetical protein
MTSTVGQEFLAFVYVRRKDMLIFEWSQCAPVTFLTPNNFRINRKNVKQL